MNIQSKTTKEKRVYTYFVSYSWDDQTARKSGFGCMTINRTKKIKNEIDLEGVMQFLEKTKGCIVVIMNFILL